MFHGIIRAATAVLLLAIAVLVYINYIRSADSSPGHSEIASAPDVPKVPSAIYNFEAPDAPALPAPPAEVAASADQPAAAPRAEQPAPSRAAAERSMPERAETPRPANRPSPRAEIVDNDPPAEVVEIAPSPRSHMLTAIEESSETAASEPRQAVRRTHVVQPGESLWVISRKYLGSGELNSKIAEYNGLSSRDHIRPGQVLVIPDLRDSSIPARHERVSEDLADDEEARHLVLRPAENLRGGAMNASVKRY